MQQLLNPMANFPVTGAGLVVLALFLVAFAVVMMRGARGDREGEAAARLSALSRFGIFVQMLGFAWTGFGPIQIVYNGIEPRLIGEGVIMVLLCSAAWTVFFRARTALAENWSFIARTRSDHQLVQTGPYALVRHPIYLCLLLWLVTMALAMGHPHRLAIALPLYIAGTLIRVHEEERLLRAMFGASFDAYAARVKRFIPGLI
jgi:protein-S-isoprenylcysteine O-methyltransferase Ste14